MVGYTLRDFKDELNKGKFDKPVKESPNSSTSSISDGERVYNEDLKAKPTYDDGTPRKPWNELSNAVKQGWEKNPTPKHVKESPKSIQIPDDVQRKVGEVDMLS